MIDSPESLADRLRSLGVNTGASGIKSRVIQKYRIEDVIKGNFELSTYGDIFVRKVLVNNAYTHGNTLFDNASISKRLIQWSSKSNKSVDLSSILFLDTETTGLSGGTGTLPFLIGVGKFTSEGFLTSQIFIRNPTEEQAQLEQLNKYLVGIEAIATYNGKAFDIPILKTRYVINGFQSPFENLLHFDLLPLSRRIWKRRLESRSLKDLETNVLEFSRNQMEVPGWEIPVIYFNYLRSGDARPLEGVFYHNAIDIQSLAAIFLVLNKLAANPETKSIENTTDILSLAIQLETSGEIDKALSLYEQLLSQELPDRLFTELQLRYSRILKRNGDFEKAADVLYHKEELADIQVMIQLAKVLEHQQKNPDAALRYTENALEILESHATDLSSTTYQFQKTDLEKRKSRLVQKLLSSNK